MLDRLIVTLMRTMDVKLSRMISDMGQKISGMDMKLSSMGMKISAMDRYLQTLSDKLTKFEPAFHNIELTYELALRQEKRELRGIRRY
mmetsp:Transcript_19779/g.27192  ORF Transcript_19779/g.27192 Transcript_19779/m.27192 type:complete len:88 (+) Transcript_19779:178-441(+)